MRPNDESGDKTEMNLARIKEVGKGKVCCVCVKTFLCTDLVQPRYSWFVLMLHPRTKGRRLDERESTNLSIPRLGLKVVYVYSLQGSVQSCIKLSRWRFCVFFVFVRSFINLVQWSMSLLIPSELSSWNKTNCVVVGSKAIIDNYFFSNWCSVICSFICDYFPVVPDTLLDHLRNRSTF